MTETLSVDQLIGYLSEKSGYSREEIMNMIKDEMEDIDNMINEEGAVYIVANKLGISLEMDQSNESLPIDQLKEGLSNVTVKGRISKIFPIRTFKRKDDTIGKVRNIELIDNTGKIKVSLWGDKADFFNDNNVTIGTIISISGGNVKAGYKEGVELSVANHGIISVITDMENEFPEVKMPEKKIIGELSDIDDEIVNVEGIIFDKMDIRTFQKEGRDGMVGSIILKDNSGKTRVIFWNENAQKIKSMSVGDCIELKSVKVSKNKYGDMELTFLSISTINKIENCEQFAELINIKNEIIAIKDITEVLHDINLQGVITYIGNEKKFERDGREGRLLYFNLTDKTGTIRIVVWGDKIDELNIDIDNVIKITSCNSKINNLSGNIEIHLTNRSQIILLDEDKTNYINTEPIFLSDIENNIDSVIVIGRIIQKYDLREIVTKDGKEAKVLNLQIQDQTGKKGKIVAWDDNIDLITNLNEGDVVKFTNVKVKINEEGFPPEIIISRNTIVDIIDDSDFDLLIQTADKLENTNYYQNSTLDHLSDGAKVRVSGTIVKVYPITIYDGCTKCGRKVEVHEDNPKIGNCPVHGEVGIEPKIIIKLILDDTNDTCQLTFFTKAAEKLTGFDRFTIKDKIARLFDETAVTGELEMKEIWVEGKVNKNDKDQLFIIVDNCGESSLSDDTDRILNSFDI